MYDLIYNMTVGLGSEFWSEILTWIVFMSIFILINIFYED